MSDSIEYCQECKNNVGCHLNRRCLKLERLRPPDETACYAIWESIKTAPKNGTEILVWREDAGTLLARWIAPVYFMTDRELEEMDGEDYLEESDWFYADFISGGRLDDQPTHWMPLPSRESAESIHPESKP